MPLANTEGGLSISLFRGAKAAAESGGFRTHVLHDRVTRASAFLFDSTADAVAFSRWIEPQVVPMRDWLAGEPIGGLSKHAKLRELETHVVGPDLPRPLRVHDRRRGRDEHDHPQLLRSEPGLRAARTRR